MQRIKFMYRQFISEPLWLKIAVVSILLIAIIFSSSAFSDNAYFKSSAKLAAAIFFAIYGVKFRRTRRLAIIFFGLAAVCLFLAVRYLI